MSAGGGAPTVLVLRPEPEATRTARHVAALGFQPVLAPLFEVTATQEAPPEGPFAAILVTSAHGAARLAALPEDIARGTPVLAVGAQTAKAASEAGFQQVSIANGDRHGLAELAMARLQAGSRLLLALGRDRHEDWIATLAAHGHLPVIWTCYEARAVTELPEPAMAALSGDRPAIALHFSQRGAQVFLALAGEAGLARGAAAARHVALSAEIAAPLHAAGAGFVAVAARPSLDSLLEELQKQSQPDAGAGVTSGFVAKIGNGAAGAGMATPQAEEERVAGKRRKEPATDPDETAQQAVGPHGEAPAPAASMAGSAASESPSPEMAASDMPGSAHSVPETATAELPAESLAAATAATHEPAAIRKGPGWGGLIAAGLLGGVIGAGAVYELQKYLPDPATGAAQQLPALEARLKALEAAQAGLAPRADLQGLAARAGEMAGEVARTRQELAAASQRLDALQARAATSGAPAPSVSPPGAPSVPLAAAPALQGALPAELAERLARAEAGLAEASGALRTALPRIAALEAGLKPLAAARSPNAAAAQLLLAERIRRALDAGASFDGDVAALAATGIPAAALAPLSALAAGGAPTREALRAELRKNRRAMAEENVAQPADWGERALRLASRIVSVERVDGGGGKSPAAQVERLDAALAANDAGAALAIWRALPEPARRASEALGRMIEGRAGAEAALARIGDESVQALRARQE